MIFRKDISIPFIRLPIEQSRFSTFLTHKQYRLFFRGWSVNERFRRSCARCVAKREREKKEGKRHQRRTVDEQTLKTSGKFSIGRHITPESLPALSLRFPIFTKAARNENSADHNYHFFFFFFFCVWTRIKRASINYLSFSLLLFLLKIDRSVFVHFNAKNLYYLKFAPSITNLGIILNPVLIRTISLAR